MNVVITVLAFLGMVVIPAIVAIKTTPPDSRFE